MLEEQRTVLAGLQQERRALADERAKFNLEHKLKQEHEQKEMVRTLKVRGLGVICCCRGLYILLPSAHYHCDKLVQLFATQDCSCPYQDRMKFIRKSGK